MLLSAAGAGIIAGAGTTAGASDWSTDAKITGAQADVSGAGTSNVSVDFSKSKLQGFSAGNPTALEFGPDGRLYVSTQSGTIYALEVERTGDGNYQVVTEEQIDAVKDIPNHDDTGDYVPGENERQVTGLTVGGTADQPLVYVSSSDPTIDTGTDDDDTDTNSGTISRLTPNWDSSGNLQSVDHDVLVMGLPRSEENHATNGLELADGGDTLYVAQGGHTNKGAPSDKFGHTPEYALSAAVLEIDLAQINANYDEKNLQSYDPQGSSQSYPDLTYLYSIPTVQGGELPFGGNDGLNMAKIVPDGPVQVFSPGYRNPYDLTQTEDGQLYVADHGPNGGWGGPPVDEGESGVCTNAPNEDGSESTGDQLHLVTEGSYGGHANPIRANPDGAGLYYANGTQYHNFTSSNSPVPSSMANPIECDYQDPSEDNSIGPTFGPTGGIDTYTASNFDGALKGDLFLAELGGSINHIELNADGDQVTSSEPIFNTDGYPLGLTTQGDDEAFPGTVWTANRGSDDVTVFEPNDYGTNGSDGGDGGDGQQCTAADDASLDEDGDGYDNADEIDAGTDPCSSASTPHDFDGDGTSDVTDDDDDNDGASDSVDPFAVDPDNGTTTSLPAVYDFAPSSHPDTILGLGFTGVMTNGQNDYQSLYDPDKLTAGGAAEVLTVEGVPKGDAANNDQQYAFQTGIDAPSEPFTIDTTVSGYPENPENYQGAGIYLGNGDQNNYLKLVVSANGGTGGVQFAKEAGGSFTTIAQPDDSAVTGPANSTDLSLTVYPNNDTVKAYYTPTDGEKALVGETTIPASWLDSSDGTGLAVGTIATSYGTSSTFDATWTDLSITPLEASGGGGPSNAAPTADAGADQTVDENATVTLDAGASSDPDGDGLSYAWTQVAGPDVQLNAQDSQTPTFTAPAVDGETTLTFEASVSDGTASATDTVNVTVQDTDSNPGDGGTQTVAQVVAGDDGAIDLAEIQQASNWWASGQEVPNTGGETISLTELQQLANVWATGQTVSGGDSGSGDGGSGTGETVFAVNAGGSQYTAADGTVYQADTAYSGGQTYSTSQAISGTENDPLYQSERYGNFGYNVPVENGTYEVTMKFAEVYHGTSNDNTDGTNVGDRVFDASAEGETILNDYDIYAQAGSLNATQETFQVNVTDGELSLNFDTEADNAKVSAIEVVQVASADGGDGDANAAPSIEPIADQTVAAGDSVPIDVSASDADGDSVALSVDGPAFVSLSNGGLTIAPESSDAGTYTVEVVADDGTTTATESFQLTVEGDGSGDSGGSDSPVGSASIAVNADSGNIDASTYNGGSFQIENTGETQISSVSFDLGTATMPDVVFDPQGTAGDSGAKEFTPDSGASAVGLADSEFTQPHNGQDGADGYDGLTATFDEFEPGEAFAFSTDIDPTSIKNAQGTGAAGSVSGLELSGATVTVEYADGTTQTTRLFGDGSVGGSTAEADANVASAPTLGVAGVSLDDAPLDSQHSGATVSETTQTVTVSGEAGGTVELLRIEGQLQLANGAQGYNVESLEANTAENVEYRTVELGPDGEATVDVTLTNTGDNGGYNYLVAAGQDADGETGETSNVVVLKVDGGGGS